ncbi:MAG TPA: LCP family protein [Ktedonobacteraceae bacterium]|nr:LCP family protein [Ktedonobacteraceae bacterium]
MRICKYCGAEIPEGAKFCGRCGRVPSDPQATIRYPSSNGPAQQSDTSSDASYPLKRSNRKPYQYVPLSADPQAIPQQPSYRPAPEPDNAYYQQRNAGPAAWQQGPPPAQQPYGTQGAPSYPSQPPLVLGGPASSPPGKPSRPLRRRKGCMIGCLSVIVLLVVLGTLVVVTGQKVLAFGSVISTQSPLSSQTNYMNTGDRVNILLMGYGGAGHDGAYLTDSLVVMSIIPSTHHTTLLSVPRDLWVQYPANSGNYTKINAIYTLASNSNANPVAGGNAIAQKVSLVTGLNIQYWMSINFAGFRQFIDSIGGVDVNVPDAFTANYPKNDDPSVNASWITVHFAKGMQHMNGATAIVYARARYVTDNPAEGTDFARSRRQQLIMQAALSKLKNWRTWPSIYGALDALKGTLYSNLSLADLASFALKMDLANAHKLGLTNNNVLVDSSADGQYILAPRNNDWQAIIDYVKQGLYN